MKRFNNEELLYEIALITNALAVSFHKVLSEYNCNIVYI